MPDSPALTSDQNALARARISAYYQSTLAKALDYCEVVATRLEWAQQAADAALLAREAWIIQGLITSPHPAPAGDGPPAHVHEAIARDMLDESLDDLLLRKPRDWGKIYQLMTAIEIVEIYLADLPEAPPAGAAG